MLKGLRENSKNLVMTIFFAIIIVVFILQFGPGSQGASCSGFRGGAYALKVKGHKVKVEDFREARRILLYLQQSQYFGDSSALGLAARVSAALTSSTSNL